MLNILNKNKCSVPFNIVIFSKDRACQLDLLLTSMRKMFEDYAQSNIYVLYTASSGTYELSYSKLKQAHSKIHFVNECNFKDDLLSLLDLDIIYTVFFVDDIVWKESFTINCDELKLLEKDDEILCLSLRLDPNLTYCYALSINMGPPNFDQEMKWDWRGLAGDFGYPMSLDGHIFRTKDILPLLDKLTYTNPNSLEHQLAENPLNKNKMICLKKAPIFNIPINKVQTINSNRHGNISAEYLNEMFLDGYRILLDPLIGFANYSCHQEVEITLKKPILNTIKCMFK